MSDIRAVVVPKELYYHEVAYVRGLEAENERLRKALKGQQDRADQKHEWALAEAQKAVAAEAENERLRWKLEAAVAALEEIRYMPQMDPDAIYAVAKAAIDRTRT